MGCKQNTYKHNITCYSHRLIWFEKLSRLRDIQKPEDALITAKIPETDFPLPKLGTADLHGPVGLDEHGLEPRGLVRWNYETPELQQHALRRGDGAFSKHGVLTANTGARTGRSPKDKYIVRDKTSKNTVWWGHVNQSCSTELFRKMLSHVEWFLSHRDELYVQDLFCGADSNHRVALRVVTETAWHAAFARTLFIRPTARELIQHIPEYTILHAPYLLADPDSIEGIDSNAFILLSLEQKIVLIGGTQYAGEIKKAMFSIMNYLLPETGHLPMHCSCNTTGNNTAVFFGLSGTGKTTLSADPSRRLVGDDEHGWTDQGIFNFEGGCYAKLINLKEEDEPAIFATTRMPGTIMENVILKPDGIPDFTDSSLTANTRGAYPLEYIENREPDGMAGHPQNIVLLTCDAFGVLPPISRLTSEQAAYHFISGYTAKVAGTEMNINQPTATFSACFGAPFMPRHPGVYAKLLSDKIAQHKAQCWLLNTGWIAGGATQSSRIKIKWTRALLNAALNGLLKDAEYRIDPRFGFNIPQSCPGVPAEILNPRDTWEDSSAYDDQADQLASMFKENFGQFAADTPEAIRSSGPQ